MSTYPPVIVGDPVPRAGLTADTAIERSRLVGDSHDRYMRTVSGAEYTGPGSSAPTQMDPTSPQGNNVIVIGDSIAIDGSSTSSGNRNAADWFAWAHLISGGKLGYFRNAGLAGDTSTLTLARFSTDVVAHFPHFVIISIGTNDLSGTPLATFANNIKAMISLARTARIKPILTTIPPRNDASGIALRPTLEAFNAWLRRYAMSQRITLLDFDIPLSDGLGGMTSTYTTDGLHPIEKGARAIGAYVASFLDPILSPFQVPLAQHQGSASPNLLLNGLFLTDSNADGLSDNWSAIGAMTPTRDLADPNIKGNWQRIASNSTAGFSGMNQVVSGTKWAVGDRLAICGRVEWDIAANGGGVLVPQMVMSNGNPNTYIPINTWTDSPLTNGIFYGEFTVSPGTTALTCYIYRSTTVSGAGGYVRVAQLTLLNLTALGALA